MDQDVVDWLLDDSEPAVRYRALTDLLGEPKDTETVVTARSRILDMAELDQLFDRQYQEGIWLFVDAKTKKVVSDRQHDKNIYFTLAALQYLAEFGLDDSEKRVRAAVENVLPLIGEFDSLQDNAVLLYPCHYQRFIRVLVMLGYRDHPNVQRLINELLSSVRWDGGYLCRRYERKRKRGKVKSCVLGAQTALMAFASLPELWQTEECQRLVDYFLNRRVLFPTQMGSDQANWQESNDIYVK